MWQEINNSRTNPQNPHTYLGKKDKGLDITANRKEKLSIEDVVAEALKNFRQSSENNPILDETKKILKNRAKRWDSFSNDLLFFVPLIAGIALSILAQGWLRTVAQIATSLWLLKGLSSAAHFKRQQILLKREIKEAEKNQEMIELFRKDLNEQFSSKIPTPHTFTHIPDFNMKHENSSLNKFAHFFSLVIDGKHYFPPFDEKKLKSLGEELLLTENDKKFNIYSLLDDRNLFGLFQNCKESFHKKLGEKLPYLLDQGTENPAFNPIKLDFVRKNGHIDKIKISMEGCLGIFKTNSNSPLLYLNDALAEMSYSLIFNQNQIQIVKPKFKVTWTSSALNLEHFKKCAEFLETNHINTFALLNWMKNLRTQKLPYYVLEELDKAAFLEALEKNQIHNQEIKKVKLKKNNQSFFLEENQRVLEGKSKLQENFSEVLQKSDSALWSKCLNYFTTYDSLSFIINHLREDASAILNQSEFNLSFPYSYDYLEINIVREKEIISEIHITQFASLSINKNTNPLIEKFLTGQASYVFKLNEKKELSVTAKKEYLLEKNSVDIDREALSIIRFYSDK